MLTVKAMAGGQAQYYLSLTASSYYTEAPEPAGRWYGLGAEEFGLKGEVAPEDLTRLCEGFDPRDESRHVRNAGKESRYHGDDLCFGAPKSVSVAWALATPEMRAAIEKAMHRAVKDALDYIQETCGYSRVGAQGQELARVPLTFALFEHSSSRLGDPHLHVHAVCPNLTFGTDARGKERVTAIDSTSFYYAQMAGGALFRASLAQGLQQLGFGVEQDGFSFRVQGVGEELCERFSRRRAEIVDGILKAAKYVGKLSQLDAREVLHAARGRMAELVNLSTRREKTEYTREQLFPVWHDIARSLGIEKGYVQTLVNNPRPLTPHQKFMVKEELFRDVLGKMSEQFSHFSEKDLTQKLAEAAQGKGLSARDVGELLEQKMSGQELVKLGEVVTAKRGQANAFRDRSETRYTTEEILKIEGQMLGAALRMSRKSAAVPEHFAEAAIDRAAKRLAEKGHKPFAEQEAAVRLLTAGEGLIACMTGKAGTGKSTTLEACREAWEMAGRTVIGCTLQGKIAEELQQTTGIPSRTLASRLFQLKTGTIRLTSKHVVVVDEAGMVATKQMAALVHQVEKAGAKLVLVGDAKQLQSIGAGGPFASISERLGEAFQCRLTNIVRQREAWRRDAVDRFSRGEAREALTAYAAQGQLHVTKTREEALEGLVGRWKADQGLERPKDVLLLASLNAEVKAINRMCQEERQQAGKLGANRLLVGGDAIHEGDRVMLGKNQKKLGVMNGFMGEVTKADAVNGWLTVKLDANGKEVTLPVEKYGAKHIRLGYASTVHKSQGVTVEHCHVLMGGHMTDLHLGYVQASRSRETTHLFIDQAHAGPGLKNAIRSLSRDRTKNLARDILDQARQAQEPAEPRPLERGRRLRHGLSIGL